MPGELDVRKSVFSLPKSRTTRIVGQAAVLTLLAGGTAAYAAADTSVTLTVDGKSEKVRTFGSSVEDILDAADVSVGERDVVAPALDESIDDGDEVVVRHARRLVVDVDGTSATYWTTALTVDEALSDLDIRADGARLSVSRSQRLGRDGAELSLVTPKEVQLLVDGKTLALTSTASDVGDLLAESGVTLGAADTVKVPLTSALSAGMVVDVDRIVTKRVTKTESIEAPVEKRKDADIYKGDTEVEAAGKDGKRSVVYRVTTVDGKTSSIREVSSTVLAKPVTKVVLVGTKARPASSSGGGSGSTGPSAGVWDRLAQCESGGNWSINTGNGYYGGVQFSLQTWRAMGGSGYPHENSKAEQIRIATKLQQRAGWGQWPSCARKLGLI